MKRINNNQLRLAVISLALFGLVGLCSADNAVANTPLTATSIVDFNGDGMSDVMLVDSGTAQWQTYDFYQGVLNQLEFGSPGDRQVVGDYDGDGLSDLAVCYDDTRTGRKMWHIEYSGMGPIRVNQFGRKGDIVWGLRGDVPVPADYDGDGRTDLATFRPSTGFWYIYLSQSMTKRIEQFGFGSDKLVPADYDGDGIADLAVMRAADNEWYIHFSSDDSIQTIGWDVQSKFTDVLVPADYDGDGRADLAVYRHEGGLWIILESYSGNYRLAQFGNGVYTGDPSQAEVTDKNYDLPMPGDFDGDSIVDISVWSSSTRVVNVLPSQSSIMTSPPVGTEFSMPVSLSVISQ